MDLDKFPYPVKPETFESPIDFPEDVTRLTSEQIGHLRSRIGAYRGYILSLWAKVEYKKIALTSQYEMKIMELSGTFEATASTKKAAKEMAMQCPDAKVIADSLLLNEQSAAFYGLMEKVFDGYMDILSRELTRRQSQT